MKLHQSNQSRALLLVGLVDIINGDYSKVPVIAEVSKSNASTSLDTKLVDLFLRDVKADGHAEEVPIGETLLFDDSEKVLGFRGLTERGRGLLCAPVVILFIHETWQVRSQHEMLDISTRYVVRTNLLAGKSLHS